MCHILSCHAPVADDGRSSETEQCLNHSFSSRRIPLESILVECFDVISHEAEFVAAQMI